MKSVAIIPSRFASTRLPGKGLADILGRPMLWWVYQHTIAVKEFDEVIVATPDDNIVQTCKHFGMNYMLTSSRHKMHIERLHEVASRKAADVYAVVCADEPLMTPEYIARVLPAESPRQDFPSVSILTRWMDDPEEIRDVGNIKVVLNVHNQCMAISRGVIPFPREGHEVKPMKIIGVECFNRAALEFYVSTPPGRWEMAEDIALLRFLENGLTISATPIDHYQLAVDYPHDLEKVRRIMAEKGFSIPQQ